MQSAPIISIVDDDESSRVGTMRLVRSLGFDVASFSSAAAFLGSDRLAQTSCLISDIQMPGMSGIELHDALRALGHDIPTILVTAFPDEKVRAQASQRGATCFLSKPFESEALSHCLDVALKRAASP